MQASTATQTDARPGRSLVCTPAQENAREHVHTGAFTLFHLSTPLTKLAHARQA